MIYMARAFLGLDLWLHSPEVDAGAETSAESFNTAFPYCNWSVEKCRRIVGQRQVDVYEFEDSRAKQRDPVSKLTKNKNKK